MNTIRFRLKNSRTTALPQSLMPALAMCMAFQHAAIVRFTVLQTLVSKATTK